MDAKTRGQMDALKDLIREARAIVIHDLQEETYGSPTNTPMICGSCQGQGATLQTIAHTEACNMYPLQLWVNKTSEVNLTEIADTTVPYHETEEYKTRKRQLMNLIGEQAMVIEHGYACGECHGTGPHVSDIEHNPGCSVQQAFIDLIHLTSGE